MRSIGLGRRLDRLFLQASSLLAIGLVLLAFVGRRRLLAADLAGQQQLARACARSVDGTISALFERLRSLGSVIDDEHAHAALRGVRLHGPFRHAVFLLDDSGVPLFVDPPGSLTSLPSPPPRRETVTTVLDRTDTSVVAIVQPVSTPAGHREIVLEMDVARSPLSQSLRDLVSGTSAELALVDNTGRVLAASSEAALLRQLSSELGLGTAISRHRTILRPEWPCRLCPQEGPVPDHVLVVQPLRYAPWALVMQARRSDLLHGVRDWLPLAAVVGLLPLLAGGLMVRAVARSLIRPLAELSHQAERLRGGDTSHPVHAEGDAEVRTLAVTLEEARQRIAAMMSELSAVNEGLERQVAARTEESRRLVRRLLGAGEEERRRIARELHDETAQLLTAIDLALASIDDGAAAERARGLLRQTQEEIHRVIHDLRPSLLDDLGLAAAIRHSAEHGLAQRGVAVSLELQEGLRLPPEVEIVVYRIFQEVTTNILRHAEAENVSVELTRRGETLVLAVEDDGIGFSTAPSRRGVGLLGMRERAELIGATLTIDSEPGAGTSVVLEVPLGPLGPEEAHSRDRFRENRGAMAPEEGMGRCASRE